MKSFFIKERKFFNNLRSSKTTRIDCVESRGNIMQAVLEQNYIAKKVNNKAEGVFGAKIGIFASLFGCWHKQLSRPFTHGKESYRACLHCGARQKFDAEKMKTTRKFYYPPTISQNERR